MRLLAAAAVARHHGYELDRSDFHLEAGDAIPSPLSLVKWLRDQGLVAKASRMVWAQLLRLTAAAGTGVVSPAVLLFTDGTAGVLVGSDATRNIVWIRDPRSAGQDAVAVDRLRLSQLWTGETILVRRPRGQTDADQPFSLMWVMRLILAQRKLMNDVGIASLTLSVLTILPPLLVMSVIDRVVGHHSLSTLVLLSTILAIAAIYETLLGYGRRELIQIISTRVDTRLQLHIFTRLLSLPLDYFERTQAGLTIHRLLQVYRVREFVTGKLMGTFLDCMTLVFLLPFLFWLNVTLSWMVVAAAGMIAIIIMIFLKPIGRLIGRVQAAESMKSSVLVESVQGIRTLKTLALEPQRKVEWDARVATSGELRLEAGRLANWPQTLITPIETFINRGVIMVGAYLALDAGSTVGVGSLVAFMMLGARVTAPLVGLAKLIEDFQEVRAAVGEVGSVLNNQPEQQSGAGLRPSFEGAISFEELTFTYPTGKTPALDKVSFSIPAGTMLGVVGRSGSGKSTLTRLLQGVNRDYSGFLKIDGAELREVNLAHLRRSFGVVLQDNFLFRGTVRDNISAGRPGLTIEDVVRAARLAGAEEFIERLPQGYDTWIEEGSSNISGGQKQRMAIARALITDPRILILDEATSALDPESEALVNANLTRIGRGRTMVIVSHRLASLVECDQILVMDRGKVIDVAPHTVLLERCAIYRALWLQQNRHMDPTGARAALLKTVAGQGD
ncbi:peptidase domain-containing ABC transporter [Acidisphaera sp. L21]|uniref:peptidase domain-containing ABC transporter n=1 Tax=Acidisphaera sp. L21 TaxID=1641851 RepID=UPI00131AE8B5|nr:peptidase domain-containing ABC transporter [Acidisphaera sp. L21]